MVHGTDDLTTIFENGRGREKGGCLDMVVVIIQVVTRPPTLPVRRLAHIVDGRLLRPLLARHIRPGTGRKEDIQSIDRRPHLLLRMIP